MGPPWRSQRRRGSRRPRASCAPGRRPRPTSSRRSSSTPNRADQPRTLECLNLAQLVIDKRYEGIPGVSLGGYVAGVAAKELGASVTVTLARVVVPGSTVTLERSESRVLVRVGDELAATAERSPFETTAPVP